ncbi:MAG: hypothetical protein GX974_08880 [Clostridiales bacterium]|nr:hypothetical protein [Clostridiales bacterium]
MKKRSEILNLSVICIHEGIDFGKVKELIIDPAQGRVMYLIIDDGNWYLGAKFIEFNSILGIGSDAITIKTIEDIKDINAKEGEVLELIKKGIKVIGAKTYSQSGEYIGEIEEFYIDNKDGSIVKCLIDNIELPSANIITYGRTVIVVEDGQLETVKPRKLEEGKLIKSENIFEHRQRQFVLGRKATKDIKDGEGHIIVSEGQIIDENIVEKISIEGKLVELTMNIK